MSKALETHIRSLMFNAGFPTASETIKFRECDLPLKQLVKVWEDYLDCKATKRSFRYADPELKMYDQ